MKNTPWICSLVGVLFALTSCASAPEIVQSVPVETTLQVPGIRLTQDVWVEMIQNAKKTIDLEHFYINHESGKSLEPVLNALKSAASRGVQIRFVLDSKFYQTYPKVPRELAALKNFQVKTIDFKRYGGIQHAKFMIVDGKDCFIGSANFDWLALSHIHEIGAHIANEALAQRLSAIFNKDFSDQDATQVQTFTNFKALPAGLEFVASPAKANPVGISDSEKGIVELITQAKQTLKIQVYQYTTKDPFSKGSWKTLDDAIRAAAARGVSVKVMVDAIALKTGAQDLKGLAQLKNVEVKTVTIPEWSGGPLQYARLIHSKFLIADQSAWIGTENWSQGYFTQSRNVGVILKEVALTAQAEKIYDQVWNSHYANLLKP